MNEKVAYNALIADKVIREFSKRNIEGFYCESKKDAVEKIFSILSEGGLISCGGSETLREICLREELKERGYNFLDPDDGVDAVEKDTIAHKALTADYFFMSCNAISETGEIINIDGYGNRVGAFIFGPQNVIIIAGINKVERSLDAAINRAKNYASRMILLKFKQDYNSVDELDKAAEYAHSHMVITDRIPLKGRVKIILIGESLGY